MRASFSTFPFLGKFSNGARLGAYARVPVGVGGRRNKSIVSSSRPPLESQAAYYSRCKGQASFAHRGPPYELNDGFIEQNEEGRREGAGFGHGESPSGKGEEPGEIKEARTELRGIISSRAGVNGKGKEVCIETPKPSYAETVIAGASGRGLIGVETLSPVHNPGGPLGNVPNKEEEEEDHTEVEVVAETAKEPRSENSNFSKKGETSPLVSDKEEEDHIDSGESRQAANMEISEGSQGYNQAITNMESLAAAVQSEAIKVPSEENQIREEALSQQLELGKEILQEVGPQPQPLGDNQEDTNSSSEEEEGCHPLSPHSQLITGGCGSLFRKAMVVVISFVGLVLRLVPPRRGSWLWLVRLSSFLSDIASSSCSFLIYLWLLFFVTAMGGLLHWVVPGLLLLFWVGLCIGLVQVQCSSYVDCLKLLCLDCLALESAMQPSCSTFAAINPLLLSILLCFS
ncbi:hypothetical protein U1Q18_012793 [Sarracenia purpurea var. burkii]